MNRLLVGYDFTAGSARALARAIRLAGSEGAAVEVVHAAPRNAGTDHPSAHRRLLTETQIMAEELGATSVEISACLRCGTAEDVILKEAERIDADLVILGGHGEPRLRDALFGTTATHVVRHGNRAVLVAQDSDSKGYSKVMIAIDDPAEAQPLLSTTFAIAPDAEAFAVRAFYPSLKLTIAGAGELEREEERLKQRIEAAVFTAAGGGEATRIDVHATVETGDVLTVLMKHYEALEPDLLAIGTRRDATYLGSHAVDTIFWCPHDLLVVPEHAKIMPAPPAAEAAPIPAAPAST